MKSINLLLSIVFLGAGIFMVLWAYNHNPEASLGERLTDALSGEKALSTTSFYAMMVTGFLLIVNGVVRLFKHLKN